MNQDRLYLGIDTSNYKTSIAIIDDSSNVVCEISELLEVKKGKRGLRQSEAFYHHSMRLPQYFGKAFETIDVRNIKAIACSAGPRRRNDSYMPCFNAGINAANMLSSVLDIPVYEVSHQEGHAAAVMPQDETKSSIFMHLSGGTSEFLICSPDKYGYDMQIVGGTKDISFGQLLDRVGVSLGYPFPSGRYLDSIACKHNAGPSDSTFIFPHIKSNEAYFNLSGAETKLLRYIESNNISSDDSDLIDPIVNGLFQYISNILFSSAVYLSDKYGLNTVYMAGGVASSRAIRDLLNRPGGPDILFGDPVLSGDNAIGVAKLSKKIYLS